ncbi:YdcF family protein [Mucilaginibacter sp. AW1-3]
MSKILSSLMGASAALLLAFAVPARGQYTRGTDAMLASRNFPLLTGLKADSRMTHRFQKDAVLLKLQTIRFKRLKQALATCPTVGCYTDSLKWQPAEVAAVGDELVKLYPVDKTLRSEISRLKTKGAYETVIKADTALLRKAWNDDAGGINRILDVYFSGAKPTYSKIDSISFQPGDPRFYKQVKDLLKGLINDKKHRGDLFFDLPLHAAIGALKMNGRDEAARYLPLSGGLNKGPYLKIKRTKWTAYPYSAILIPGLGPETAGVPLDPGGARRCDDGAKRFRKGLAPFMIVSGGHVHPFKTTFNEAVEMKRYLVTQLGIPAGAVLIEPHARHTTTNLRNANRMIYRFSMPVNKPILIVTDSSQTNYMCKGMEKVALRDLGYVPYRDLKKLNDKETAYYPNWASLQVNSKDPLDP